MRNGSQAGILRSEARAIDENATSEYGIPGLVLMENAGIRASEEIERFIALNGRKSISILAGAGNNGGDGFVVARQLAIRGFPVQIHLCVPENQILAREGDAALNFRIAQKMRITISPLDLAAAGPGSFPEKAVLVDGIFGTGLTRPVRGDLARLLQSLHPRRQDVVSLDLPSGLDCDSGEVLGAAIKAHTTITFVAPKRGFFRRQGPDYTGRIAVASIGSPLPQRPHQSLPRDAANE